MNPRRPLDLKNFLIVYSLNDRHAWDHCRPPTEHPITALSLLAGLATFTANFSGTRHLFANSRKLKCVHLLTMNQHEPLILFQPNHPLAKEDRLSLGLAMCFHYFTKAKSWAPFGHESMRAIDHSLNQPLFTLWETCLLLGPATFCYFTEDNLRSSSSYESTQAVGSTKSCMTLTGPDKH